MTGTFTRSLAAMAALGATTIIALPASAMTFSPADSGASMIHQSNWSDRVRGRTSSSTPPLGYGWLWGDEDVAPRYRRSYRRHAPYGYDRSEPQPYGYDESAY